MLDERLKQIQSRVWLRPALLSGTAATAALIAILSYFTGALAALERQTVDARFGIRGARPPGNNIAVVGVDAQTFSALRASFAKLPRADYASLLDRLRAAHPAVIGMDVQFLGKTDARDDRSLVGAVARDGPIVLTTHDASGGPIPVPAGVRNARGAVRASAAVDVDSDGVLRRMIYAPVALKTFAVRVAELLTGRPIGDQHFPGNHAWVDFRGPPGTFRTVSALDVLEGRVPSGSFAGKAVLIGITDPVGRDVFVTATSSVPMSGVEFQANALSTILRGFPLQPLGGGAAVLMLLLLASFPAAVASRFAALWVLIAALAVVGGFLVVAQLAFNGGTILPVTDGLLALVLGTIGAIAAESFVERKQLRNLQELFDLLPSAVSDFFISYRRNQSELAANTLREGLVRRFGEERVFMDVDAITPGQQWPKRVEHAVAACRAILVVIGPQWSDARAPDGSRRLDDREDWVRREIEVALSRSDVAVVPVLHDHARPPSDEELPDSIRALARRQAVELTGRQLDRWIDELSESIQKDRLRESLPFAGEPTIS
jgi:CHASE2 domain-containing sensor protein